MKIKISLLRVLFLALVILPFTSPVVADNSEELAILMATNSCPNCNLRGADLRGLPLIGADFSGAVLEGASLEGVNLW